MFVDRKFMGSEIQFDVSKADENNRRFSHLWSKQACFCKHKQAIISNAG